MLCHNLASGGREERLSASAGRSQVEELQEVSMSNAKNSTPNNGGDPAMNALPDRKPVEYVSRVVTDMTN